MHSFADVYNVHVVDLHTYNNDPDVFNIFRLEELAKIMHEGRYLCNRGPEGANYEVICPRAVTYIINQQRTYIA